ncbi:MAG: DUF3520 domain-containing protein [Verrucomicrobiaceae bacterium]|nr:DUF3520 domain-containing protein [Verrucomicrobiaceae bacterium]
MNMQDNPDFTAYTLGELSAEEAGEMHALLAGTPAASHELEQIEAVADALRHGAPLPHARLSHEQRHAVLHPANLPRRVQPLMPRKPAPRPQPVFWPLMGGLLKAAAVLAVTGAAFLTGWSLKPEVRALATTAAMPPKAQEKPRSVTPPVPGPSSKIKAEPVAPKLAMPELVKSEPRVEVKTPPVVKEILVVNTPPPAPVSVASPNFGFSMPEGRGAFASTTKQAVDQLNLRPSQIKPTPPKARGEMFASPQLVNTEPDVRPARVSELFLHSWKAEVATCPWNPANRLLRVVIQLPANQKAVFSPESAFPLQITFDTANVKQFRKLCERHIAATSLDSAGAHVLWYEFQPNGTAGAPRDRQIANMTLPNARFTAPLVGPFDSGGRMQVIDRGYSLQNAREDFVFESAVVGFGLLLRGAEQTGGLNHDLVLNLAKQAKGVDAGGVRAHFIRLVQDAQKVAGL